jgi:hypothetical protein
LEGLTLPLLLAVGYRSVVRAAPAFYPIEVGEPFHAAMGVPMLEDAMFAVAFRSVMGMRSREFLRACADAADGCLSVAYQLDLPAHVVDMPESGIASTLVMRAAGRVAAAAAREPPSVGGGGEPADRASVAVAIEHAVDALAVYGQESARREAIAAAWMDVRTAREVMQGTFGTGIGSVSAAVLETATWARSWRRPGDWWALQTERWRAMATGVGASAVAERFDRLWIGAGIDWDWGMMRLSMALWRNGGEPESLGWPRLHLPMAGPVGDEGRPTYERDGGPGPGLDALSSDRMGDSNESGNLDDLDEASVGRDVKSAEPPATMEPLSPEPSRSEVEPPRPRRQQQQQQQQQQFEPMVWHEEREQGVSPPKMAPPPSLPRPLATSRAVPKMANGGGLFGTGGGGGSTDELEPEERRLVNTGFCEPEHLRETISPDRPLRPRKRYYFWLEVGTRVEGAIDTSATGLPVQHVPREATLDVVVFAVPGKHGQFELSPGEERGQLRLRGSGVADVRTPASQPRGAGKAMLARRLFFAVKTPPKGGEVYRLRCGVYYKGVLVQSRLVQAVVRRSLSLRHPVEVESKKEGRAGALRTDVDYTIARRLDAAVISEYSPQRLSVMVNGTGDGTHAFFFHGSEEKGTGAADGDAGTHEGRSYRNVASIGEGDLADLVKQARGALRRAAWGSDAPWQTSSAYFYEENAGMGWPQKLERLARDLTLMASRGYRIYDTLAESMAGGAEAADRLREWMRTPGDVQIAGKYKSRLLVPAAIMYDYPLKPQVGGGAAYALCPEFSVALQAGSSLQSCACMNGDCPTRTGRLLTTVCPSGFWGFRHAIGMPLSLGERADAGQDSDDAAGVITYQERARVAVGVSTDPALAMRAEHEKRLREALGYEGTDEAWSRAATREEVIALLGKHEAHVVYFYCHGEVIDAGGAASPCIIVGPKNSAPIERANLRDEVGRFSSPRPLVFINGCHTTALEPEAAIDLVSGFIERVNASGVIGTEITMFEPLACAFAEELLPRLIVQGEPLGWAVRNSRLAMLSKGNPLGLAYLPFALPGLRVRKSP